MEVSYTINFRSSNGASWRVEAKSKEEKDRVIEEIIGKDKSITASVLVAEYEKETPNKQSVMLENYAYQNDKISKLSQF